MNTGISFDQAVNAFVVVCNTMFFYFGISPQEIRDSSYYNSFFVASYNVACAMARSPVYTGKVKFLCSNGYYDEDDIVHMLTLQIVRKYAVITIAMSKNGDKMDLKNYVSAIVRNTLNSLLRKSNNHSKKDTKDKENKDESEKDTKKTKSSSKELMVKEIVSLDAPLKINGRTTLLDMQQSEKPTPEERVIDEEENKNAIDQVYNYLKIFSKRGSKGYLFALVYSCLDDKGDIIAKEVKDRMADICNENENMFWVIYNMLLVHYAKSIGMDIERIMEFMAFDLSEFGRSFSAEYYEDFSNYISHRKNCVKNKLAKLLNIDLGTKQVRSK